MARILIVDDDSISRDILREILEDAGHQVVEASTTESGIKNYRELVIDLVVTDLFVPEKGGLQVIQKIREADPDVGIIAVSGMTVEGKDQIFEAAKRGGANHTLEKPVKPEDLREAVRTLLS